MLCRTLTFAWVASFERAFSQRASVCSAVMQRHEKAVNRYGYSLLDLYARVVSPLLASLLVPPMPDTSQWHTPAA
jgi:hypothetical protein